MSNIHNLKPQDLAMAALFQATGNPIFDAEQAIAPATKKGPPASCYELEVDGVPIKFTGTYYPGSKGRIERGTGIPQEPDDPPCFEVEEIWIGDVEVSALLNQWADGVVNKLEAHGRGANNDD